MPNGYHVVGDVDHDHQRDRVGDPGGHRELRERDDLHQVHHPDEEEQCRQERQVTVALLAHHRAHDLVPDEYQTEFAQVLYPPGHKLRLGERGPEEPYDSRSGDYRQQHRLGEVERADGEDGCVAEVLRVSGRRVPAAGEEVTSPASDHVGRISHRMLLQPCSWPHRPASLRRCSLPGRPPLDKYAVYSTPSFESLWQDGEIKNANMHRDVVSSEIQTWLTGELENFEGDFLFSPAKSFQQEVAFMAYVFEAQNKFCYPLLQEKL